MPTSPAFQIVQNAQHDAPASHAFRVEALGLLLAVEHQPSADATDVPRLTRDSAARLGAAWRAAHDAARIGPDAHRFELGHMLAALRDAARVALGLDDAAAERAADVWEMQAIDAPGAATPGAPGAPSIAAYRRGYALRMEAAATLGGLPA